MSNLPPSYPAGNQPTPPMPPQQPYASAPGTRSKGIAWTALALAIAGVLAAAVALIPLLWLSFALALLAFLLLLAAFVFALVGLIGKRHGGNVLSIVALVLSIGGAAVAAVALFLSLLLIGFAESGDAAPAPTVEVSAAPSPAPTEEQATPEPTEEATDPAPDAAAEAAFLADVRPKVNDIMAQTDPPITADIVQSVFPDEQLLLMGQTLLVAGDAGFDAIVDATVAQTGDVVPADTLRQLYQTVYDSAKIHLR